MPTASRNERRKRRQRRNISLLTREVRSLNARHFNASVSLLGVLKASGGSVTVPKDVAAELMQEYHTLKWQATRQENGDVVVELIAPSKADEQADPIVGDRSVTAQLGQTNIDAEIADAKADAEVGASDAGQTDAQRPA